jgi:ankyrin repeat protein
MEYDADIFDAVEFGDLEIVKLYWTDEINIDWQDSNGMNLVMTACLFGHIEIVKHLLKYGPDLTIKNMKEQTVLDIAQELNHQEIIALLSEV